MTGLPLNSIDDRLYVLRTRWDLYVVDGRFDQFIEFAVAINSLAERFQSHAPAGLDALVRRPGKRGLDAPGHAG